MDDYVTLPLGESESKRRRGFSKANNYRHLALEILPSPSVSLRPSRREGDSVFVAGAVTLAVGDARRLVRSWSRQTSEAFLVIFPNSGESGYGEHFN